MQQQTDFDATNVVSGSRPLVISTFPDNLLVIIIFLFI